MALDGIFLGLVREELLMLIGGRVEKIYQPSKEELIFGMRTRDGAYRLLINSAAGTARVHVTAESIENPKTPPMFCMLMRKHLSSGKLIDIRQDGCERILYFDFDAANEMGDIVRLTLAVEIMGRRSNIILIDGEGRIIDSIKRVTPEMSSVRPVLSGMKYTLPPRTERLLLEEFDSDKFKSALSQFGGKRLSGALVSTFEGISPVFADEAVEYSTRGDDKAVSELSENELDRLCFFFSKEAEKLRQHRLQFTIIKTPDGQFKDFCFTEIHHFGTLMVTKQCESACALLDEFYSQRDRLERIKQKAQDLFKLIVSLSDRTARRVANQKRELLDCADREQLKIKGDLIMTNLYSLEKGMTSFKCLNYYSENGEEMEIALDPRMTPQQNAQRYYKEYKKADTAEKKLTELIAQGEQEQEYLDSVFDSLTRADSEADISQLREELCEQGYIRKRGAKTKSIKSLPPLKFISTDGFTILVGRHNRQNDRLTLKDSQKTDIWLHTQGITGSHTVICCEGKQPPFSTIEQAARIAAYHSKGQNSSQVPVDYTLIKYVKKPVGAKPGMVIFTNQKTLYVKPDKDEISALKAK